MRLAWRRGLGFGLIASGVVIAGVGYLGVTHSRYDAERLSFIVSGGIGGLFLIGVGLTMVVLVDQVEEGHRLDQVEVEIREGRWPVAVALGESQLGREGAAGSMMVSERSAPDGERDRAVAVSGAVLFVES